MGFQRLGHSFHFQTFNDAFGGGSKSMVWVIAVAPACRLSLVPWGFCSLPSALFPHSKESATTQLIFYFASSFLW